MSRIDPAEDAPVKERRRALGTAAAASALIAVSLLPPASIMLRPAEGAAVAAIFAPWRSAEETMAAVIAADGLPLRGGGFANVLIARSEEAGFVSRLYRAGAWAVIDSLPLRGCGRDLRADSPDFPRR